MGFEKHNNQTGVSKGYTKFRFDLRLNGERHRKLVTCRQSAVNSIYRQWEDQIYSGVTKSYKLFEIIDQFNNHLSKRVEAKDLSKSFYTHSVQRLNFVKTYFKNIDLNTLNRSHIDDLILHLKSEGLKDTTINTYIKSISMMINWCIDRNLYQGNNPATRQFLSEKESIRKIELTKDQINEIIEKSKVDLKLHTCIMLALFTGMRRREQFLLTWGSVDFNNNIITVKAEVSKTDTSREIPLNKELKKYLLQLKLSSNSVKVITGYVHEDEITRQWIKFRSCLSMCNDGMDLHYNDLRHIFTQILLDNNVDVLDIAQWAGHSTKILLTRYANIQRRTNYNMINVLNSEKDGQCMVNDVAKVL